MFGVPETQPQTVFFLCFTSDTEFAVHYKKFKKKINPNSVSNYIKIQLLKIAVPLTPGYLKYNVQTDKVPRDLTVLSGRRSHWQT